MRVLTVPGVHTDEESARWWRPALTPKSAGMLETGAGTEVGLDVVGTKLIDWSETCVC